MISLVMGIMVLMSFSFVLYECVKEERDKKIWIVNSLNLIIGILLIFEFF